MSIRRRLVLLLVAILIVSSTILTRQLLDSFRRAYSSVVENLMFDFATALASQVEASGGIAQSGKRLDVLFRTYREKRAQAPTNHADVKGFDIYVTDERGIVVYASADASLVGQDYSRWNDVYLALRDRYGARSTRTDPNDPRSSVYFVAAPVREGKEIRGVVSVIKSEQSVSPFLDRAFRQVAPYGIAGLLLVALFTALTMTWITRPILRLRDYALGVSRGEGAIAPDVGPPELKSLRDAFEKMRITLEGKRQVESFVQGLVHELKSPLTAIRGSAELSLENISAERREKFLRNILDENGRLQRLLDELLNLARLETRYELKSPQRISLGGAVERVVGPFEGAAEAKRLRFEIPAGPEVFVDGDAELLEAAIRNLIVNAIDFSPEGGRIRVNVSSETNHALVAVEDEGPGVPEFARARIFERFYSLERPGRSEKSTGLGLNFVQEIMKLHRGSVTLADSPRGARFELRFPKE